MQVVVKVASLNIHEDTKKEALQSLAKKIDKISNIPFWTKDKSFVFNVVWDDNAPDYSAVLTVYYKFDDTELRNRHCEICAEVHRTFYMTKKIDCTHCEYAAFLKREEERVRDMKSAGRDILKRNF